jgi:uncharacterized protein (TIGR00290 family)
VSRLRAVVSWSSGKDAAFALHLARLGGEVEIAGLLSSINAEFQRVSMHGVRRELLEQQARAAGLPLQIVELPWPCPNEEYERRMAAACQHLREQGIEAVIFGDIHLADVRDYREQQMARAGLKPLFPLWGRDSRQLLEEMLAAGVRARIVCLDPRRLSPAFAGAELSAALLPSLPEGVDPCGENGEFHTFVTHAPVFSAPVEVTAGAVIERDGFLYADLLPASGAMPADA